MCELFFANIISIFVAICFIKCISELVTTRKKRLDPNSHRLCFISFVILFRFVSLHFSIHSSSPPISPRFLFPMDFSFTFPFCPLRFNDFSTHTHTQQQRVCLCLFCWIQYICRNIELSVNHYCTHDKRMTKITNREKDRKWDKKNEEREK